jgi:hypothetical protein
MLNRISFLLLTISYCLLAQTAQLQMTLIQEKELALDKAKQEYFAEFARFSKEDKRLKPKDQFETALEYLARSYKITEVRDSILEKYCGPLSREIDSLRRLPVILSTITIQPCQYDPDKGIYDFLAFDSNNWKEVRPFSVKIAPQEARLLTEDWSNFKNVGYANVFLDGNVRLQSVELNDMLSNRSYTFNFEVGKSLLLPNKSWISEDARRVFWIDYDNTFNIQDTRHLMNLVGYTANAKIACRATSTDGRYIAFITVQNKLLVFSTSNGILLKEITIPELEEATTAAVLINSRDTTVLVGVNDNLLVYDMIKGVKTRSGNTLHSGITSLALSADGRFFLVNSGGSYKDFELVETSSLKSIPLDITKRRLVCSAIATRKNIIAFVDFSDSRTNDKPLFANVVLWDFGAMKKLFSIDIGDSFPEEFPRMIMFSKDDRLLAIASTKEVLIIDLQTKKPIFKPKDWYCHSIDFDNNSHTLLAFGVLNWISQANQVVLSNPPVIKNISSSFSGNAKELQYYSPYDSLIIEHGDYQSKLVDVRYNAEKRASKLETTLEDMNKFLISKDGSVIVDIARYNLEILAPDNVDDKKSVSTIINGGFITAAFDPTEKLLLALDGEKLNLIDLQKQAVVFTKKLPISPEYIVDPEKGKKSIYNIDRVFEISFSPYSNKITFSNSHGCSFMVDRSTLEVTNIFDDIVAFTYNPKLKQVFLANKTSAGLYSYDKQLLLNIPYYSGKQIRKSIFSQNGNALAILWKSDQNTPAPKPSFVSIINCDNLKQIKEFEIKANVETLSITYDGRFVMINGILYEVL